ncbi:MAG: glycosyltransferase [Candidatus Heimdallarchaeaceae archaeon]
MRVLFVSRGLGKPMNGAETASKLLYDSLSQSLDLYALTDDKNFKGKGYVFFNPTYKVKIPILEYFSFRFFGKIKLKKVSKKIKPHIIINSIYSGYAIPSPKSIKTIIWFHDDPSFSIKDTISPRLISSLLRFWYSSIQYFKRAVIKSRYLYLSISNNMTTSLKKLGINSNKIFTLSYGLYYINDDLSNHLNDNNLKEWYDFKKKHELYDNDFLLLFVGTIYFNKGLHTIIQSLGLINQENYKLLVAGSEMPFFGKYYAKKLKKLIKKLGLENQVIWLGHVDKSKLKVLYKNCTAVISSSYSEGCQLSLLEAAYYNAPIIASTVGSVEDQFGKKAILFPPGDFEDLAKKLLEMNKKKPEKIKYHLDDFKQFSNKVMEWLYSLKN